MYKMRDPSCELLCGIQRKHPTQHALFTHLFPVHPFLGFWCFNGVEKGCIGNKWLKATSELVGRAWFEELRCTILMKLSKAYMTVYHMIKSETHGLDADSLYFLLDYLSLGKHRTKPGIWSIANGLKFVKEYHKVQIYNSTISNTIKLLC